MSHTRRGVLLTMAGMAGCLGRSGPLGSPSPTPTPDVRLGEFVHRHSFLHRVHPDTLGVMAPGDRQFLFVGVEAIDADPPPEPAALELVADDRYGGWVEFEGRGPVSLETGVNRERPYDPDALVGWVGFDLPVPFEAPTANIERTDVSPTVSWAVPEDVLAALEQPAPSLEVSNVRAPETVAPDEPVEVTFDIENTGSVPGVFRGCLNNLGPLYAPSSIRRVLEPGDAVTERQTIDYYTNMDMSTAAIRFRLITPHQSFGFDVTVHSAG